MLWLSMEYTRTFTREFPYSSKKLNLDTSSGGGLSYYMIGLIRRFGTALALLRMPDEPFLFDVKSFQSVSKKVKSAASCI